MPVFIFYVQHRNTQNPYNKNYKYFQILILINIGFAQNFNSVDLVVFYNFNLFLKIIKMEENKAVDKLIYNYNIDVGALIVEDC